MNKIEVFNDEINYIKSSKYKENLKIILEMLPDYFFHVQASSTGKYHPSFALGDSGLIRHTKVAVRIAHELLENNSISNFNNDEKDLIIISLILHDSFKHGITEEKYTRFDHPLIVGNFLKENRNKFTLTDKELEFIINNIASHMGEWNKDYQGNEILPLPKTKSERFVHMCDYLSSKKFLNVNFDKNNNIEG